MEPQVFWEVGGCQLKSHKLEVCDGGHLTVSANLLPRHGIGTAVLSAVSRET
jgi:hypothetical protein